MSGWTSSTGSVSGSWLKRLVVGSLNGSGDRRGRLVRLGTCHSRSSSRGVRLDARWYGPQGASLPGWRGLGGFRGLRILAIFLGGGREHSVRRCPFSPHRQHTAVCSLAPAGGRVFIARLSRVFSWSSFVPTVSGSLVTTLLVWGPSVYDLLISRYSSPARRASSMVITP